MSTEGATLRAEVERHIRERVEGERGRVERVSRIREPVLGAQDGLLRVARQRQVRAGMQVLVIGGMSAAAGFGIGHVTTTLV